MSYQVPVRWLTGFDPAARGWRQADQEEKNSLFPEVKGRGLVPARDYWLHEESGTRIVVEWTVPGKVVLNVLRDGHLMPETMTSWLFEQLWHPQTAVFFPHRKAQA